MRRLDHKVFAGKPISEVLDFADNLCNGDLNDKLSAHSLYNLCLRNLPKHETPSTNYIRGNIRQNMWNCEKAFGWNQEFPSQAGQDKFIKEHFFKNLDSGFFLEIGAHDGVSGSNCFHFENYMNWNGIAVEASANQYKFLHKNRKCHTMHAAVSGKVQELEFFEIVEGLTQMSGLSTENYAATLKTIENHGKSKIVKNRVKTITVSDILKEQKSIDLLSIDVEGAEMEILQSVDFKKYEFRVISVENNQPEKQDFIKFFENSGFSFFERLGMDEIYYHPERVSFKRL